MSYDLWLLPRSGRALDNASFVSFFKNRKWYQLDGEQASYVNEDTGVYFSFDFVAEADDEEEEDDLVYPHIFFNINYVRPHIFGLEAEQELSSVVSHFDAIVSDPQNDGMGDGEYTADGFLKGWNCGNRFGYGAFVSRMIDDQSLYAAPAARLESNWEWTYNREELSHSLGNGIFVPKFAYWLKDGQVVSGVVWGDAMSVALPEADYYLLVRQDIGKKGFLSFLKKMSMSLVKRDELAPHLSNFPKRESSSMSYWHLDYSKPPGELIDLFLAQPEIDPNLLLSLPVHEVLTKEIVDEVLAGEAGGEPD